MNATAFRYASFQCFSCQRTAPASRRSLGTQLLRPQCDLQEAEIQDGAVEVLSEKLKENVPSVPIFPHIFARGWLLGQKIIRGPWPLHTAVLRNRMPFWKRLPG